jgi:hypothetical protein
MGVRRWRGVLVRQPRFGLIPRVSESALRRRRQHQPGSAPEPVVALLGGGTARSRRVDSGGGHFDASPREPSAFNELVNGACAEVDPTAEQIWSPRHGEVVSHWCITSLTTHPAAQRRVGGLGALLVGSVGRLASKPEAGGPSAWCAVGQSQEGGRLPRHVGFRVHRNSSQTPYGKPSPAGRRHTAADASLLRSSLADLAATCARRRAVLHSRLLDAA